MSSALSALFNKREQAFDFVRAEAVRIKRQRWTLSLTY